MRTLFWPKVAAHLLGLAPFAWLAWRINTDRLGADPVQEITHFTGDWTLRILLLTLAITPLRRLSGWNVLARFRRLVGLYAFFYACLHFSCYLVLDLAGYWAQIAEDIVKRPYITVGFTAWLGLLVLALTSPKFMVRKLGRRWAALHKIVYAIGVLGVLHYLWLVKADLREPLLYAAILALLLIARIPALAGRLSAVRTAKSPPAPRRSPPPPPATSRS